MEMKLRVIFSRFPPLPLLTDLLTHPLQHELSRCRSSQESVGADVARVVALNDGHALSRS